MIETIPECDYSRYVPPVPVPVPAPEQSGTPQHWSAGLVKTQPAGKL